jgi:hypothetical protein
MDVETAKKRLEEVRRRKQRKDFWSASPGENEIRILPNWKLDPHGDFYRETAYHKHLGTSGDKQVVCLIREGEESCPVCALQKQLYKTKDPQDVELAKSIKAQTRVLWNIVDLKDKEKGVQIWMTGIQVLEDVLAYCANLKFGDITHPITGRNITVVFTEAKNTVKGFNEYKIQADPQQSEIDPEWLENLVDLDSLVKTSSYEEIEDLLSGKPPEETTPTSPPKESPSTQEAAPPPCFKNAKFSKDDPECLSCVVSGKCKERQGELRKFRESKASVAATAETTAPAAQGSESKDDKKFRVKAMLDELRKKSEKNQ